MKDFEEAVAIFGKELGIELQENDGAVSFDAIVDVDAGVALQVDVVHIPENKSMLVSADLGELPQEGEDTLCRTFMEANHFFEGTGGATLSVEHESRHVRFEFCIPLVLLGNEVDSVFLERFLNAAERWRKHLTAPPETAIGFMPHFTYIMS